MSPGRPRDRPADHHQARRRVHAPIHRAGRPPFAKVFIFCPPRRGACYSPRVPRAFFPSGTDASARLCPRRLALPRRRQRTSPYAPAKKDAGKREAGPPAATTRRPRPRRSSMERQQRPRSADTTAGGRAPPTPHLGAKSRGGSGADSGPPPRCGSGGVSARRQVMEESPAELQK